MALKADLPRGFVRIVSPELTAPSHFGGIGAGGGAGGGPKSVNTDCVKIDWIKPHNPLAAESKHNSPLSRYLVWHTPPKLIPPGRLEVSWRQDRDEAKGEIKKEEEEKEEWWKQPSSPRRIPQCASRIYLAVKPPKNIHPGP